VRALGEKEEEMRALVCLWSCQLSAPREAPDTRVSQWGPFSPGRQARSTISPGRHSSFTAHPGPRSLGSRVPIPTDGRSSSPFRAGSAQHQSPSLRLWEHGGRPRCPGLPQTPLVSVCSALPPCAGSSRGTKKAGQKKASTPAQTGAALPATEESKRLLQVPALPRCRDRAA